MYYLNGKYTASDIFLKLLNYLFNMSIYNLQNVYEDKVCSIFLLQNLREKYYAIKNHFILNKSGYDAGIIFLYKNNNKENIILLLFF